MLEDIGSCVTFTNSNAPQIRKRLSAGNPYAETPLESLKLLGFADDGLRPLPVIAQLWKSHRVLSSSSTVSKESYVRALPRKRVESNVRAASVGEDLIPSGRMIGKVTTIRRMDGYAFIRTTDGSPDVFVHRSSFLNGAEWGQVAEGTDVEFEYGFASPSGRARPAHHVSIVTLGKAQGVSTVEEK